MKPVKKAIIPAAGLGTRFLPATKAMPKEMLPIVDKPTIQYIVEEAIESGIEDIIVVTGKGKRAIEDHFDYAVELEQELNNKGKFELLQLVQNVSEMVNIHYIRQKEAKGLGHAIWCARKFIGDEPFAVLLGDDLVDAEVPCIKQLINVYEKKGSSIVGVQQVPFEDTSRYGIISPLNKIGQIYEVEDLVEKPFKGKSPSNLAIMGRYILTPEIFPILEKQKCEINGEIQLTDSIRELNKFQSVFALNFEGKRFDVGEKLGFLVTNIEYALKNSDLKIPLLNHLHQILIRENITL
ncbi:UTP--glucose-1-phosphate uridylyltransferase GalU [Gottfriedia sp. NPDC057991]|uniref:UTP--glucose-1-phosphate uridylyltransferase GalU n=1 Tax=Gottfriedia sp. NPDC057991 TaxID=3346298 RepID=UPI0036D911A2